MKTTEWYRVENLMKQEVEEIEKYENGEKNLSGDFQSYRMLVESDDYEVSNIGCHNTYGNDAKFTAFVLVDQLLHYIKKEKVRICTTSLADLGGGCGFIANGMKKFFNNVFSYDISRDAGVYGRNHFPEVDFITKGLFPDDILKEGPFDVILANEFYPFTRNADWDYQKSYIDMVLCQDLEQIKMGDFSY